MSTCSYIGMLQLDGTVIAVYCHNDGYPSHNGRILLEAYDNEKKVSELLALGNLSILDREIYPKPGLPHAFGYKRDAEGWPIHFAEGFLSNRQEGVCLFYGRDRGEKGENAFFRDSAADFFRNRNDWDIDYKYLFHPDTGEWECANGNGQPYVLTQENTK